MVGLYLQMKYFSTHRAALVALCLLFLASCWHRISLETTRLAPGAMPLPGVHRIALGQIAGEDGASLSAALTQTLLGIDGLALVSPPRRDAVSTWNYAPAAAADYDAVDAIVVGHIDFQNMHESIDFEPLTGHYAMAPTMRYSRRGTATLEATLSVVDARSGRILGQSRLRHIHTSADEYVDVAEGFVRDNDEIFALFGPLDEHGIFAEAHYALAQRFAAQVAPRREPVTVIIYTLNALPQSLWAQQAIEAGDWLQAMALYAQGVDEMESRGNVGNSDRAKAYYNLGLAYGYAGYYPEARQTLSIALRLDDTAQTRATQRQIEQFAREAELAAADFVRGGIDF